MYDAVCTVNNMHTYKRSATEEEVRGSRDKKLDLMGSDK